MRCRTPGASSRRCRWQLSAIPLSLIPLAYASAIVRYRLRDIEVIIKRAVVFATIVAVVVAHVRRPARGRAAPVPVAVVGQDWVIALLGTLVALLLAPPVKDVVQTTLDRAFYRDRYDYRRALVGFARDLNSDLDPASLAQRLVSRVVETLVVDRMAMLMDQGRRRPVRRHAQPRAGRAGPDAGADVGASVSGSRRRGAVTLDDPTAVARYAPEDIDAWRDAGLFYFVPCVSKAGTTAVLALGLKHGTEPLSSEDMALLAAVAGQIATALENARLYRQLHVKAVELDRLRGFNENILESLDDGLLVADLDDRIVRWNDALERAHGVSAAARPSAGPLDGAVRRPVPRGGARGPPRVACGGGPVAGAARRALRRHRRRAAGQRGGGAAACVARRRRRHRRYRRHPAGRDRSRAAGGAAADLREDGVDRPAGGRRGARGEHAADRHLQLHADAAAGRRPRRSAHAPAREDRAPDVPGGQDRQRAAEPVAAGLGGVVRPRGRWT